MSSEAKKESTHALNRVREAVRKIASFQSNINRRMEGKYSPELIGMGASVAAALLLFFMLFLPPYLGVADDGSLSRVMNSAGVYYQQTEVASNYNNYFVRLYSNYAPEAGYRGSFFNSQVALVRLAVWFDNVVTRDRVFDIRFLALLYGILYVPAVYLLVRQASMRVKKFSEGMVIGLLGVVFFADVGYITFFNSFYPEALWLVSLLYVAASAFSFQEDRGMAGDLKALVVFTVFALLLLSSRRQCAVLGFLFAGWCIKLLFIRKNWKWGLVCMTAAFLLCSASVGGLLRQESDFDNTSKFHAMTRGVLFQSDNPARTLQEFGIDPSYELLADTSGYDALPFVTAEDPAVYEDFLAQYTQADIALYYVKHPGKLLAMTDLAIKACFGIRRESCGNYEQSVGMAPQARSLFWGVWSRFKNFSAPKTIGFLALLGAAALLLYRKGYSLRPEEDRRNTVFMDGMAVLFLICLVQAGVAIIGCGDAQMIQHCFLISASMDIMVYFILAELVHKINIF